MNSAKKKPFNSQHWELMASHVNYLSPLPERERSDFLDQMQKADPEMAAQLRELLKDETKLSKFYSASPADALIKAVQLTNLENVVPSLESNNQAFKPGRIGRYLLLDVLGRGGMAQVYRAKLIGDSKFSKTLAAKRILVNHHSDPTFIHLFEAEARLSSQLNHPNIVQVFDFFKADDGYLLVMEYIPGKSLSEVIRSAFPSGNPISVPIALYIVESIAKALHYAYHCKKESGEQQKIIHRDISPHNIMISYEGAVKVVDFGIAKASGLDVEATRTGTLKGKIAYMAPEQAALKPVDHRTDIYACGLVLYELLTGVRARSGTDEIAILTAAREGTLVPPQELNPDIPNSISAVILKATAMAPEDRYQTGQQFAEALRAVLNQLQQSDSDTELSKVMHYIFGNEIAIERIKVQMDSNVISKILTSDSKSLIEGAAGTLLPTEKDFSPTVAFQSQALQKEINKRFKKNHSWVDYTIYGLIVVGMLALLAKYRHSNQTSTSTDLLTSAKDTETKISNMENPQTNINTLTRSQTLTSVNESTQSNSATLPFSQSHLNEVGYRILKGKNSRSGDLIYRVEDKGAVHSTEGRCRLSSSSMDCGRRSLIGTSPFILTLKGTPKKSTDALVFISRNGCLNIAPNAQYNEVTGSCNIPLTNPETDILVNLELK